MAKDYTLSEELREYLKNKIGIGRDYSRDSTETLRQLYKDIYEKVVGLEGELYGRKVPTRRDTLIKRIQTCNMIILLNDLSKGESEHGK